jgi:Tol biopolymer transport system component
VWLAAAALSFVAVTALILPAAWRAKWFGGRGGSPPAQRGSAARAAGSSTAIRKVAVPAGYMFLGGPSLDGTLLSISDATGNIAVVDLATGEARRLTSDAVMESKASQYAEWSAISADNRFVAYSWYALDGSYEIRIVDMDGRRPRVLLRSAAVNYPDSLEWARDGESILAAWTRPDHAVQLALVSVEDGAVRPIKTVGPLPPHHASLSPDGQFVVYDAPQPGPQAGRDVFIVRTDGSDDRVLIEHPANDADPVWTPDGHGVLFVSDRSGTMDLWTVDVDRGFATGIPRLVHRNMGRMWLRGLTDTGRYFFDETVGAVDVYLADITNGAVKNLVALPTTFSGSNISSVWSPDGRRLAYASRRGLVGFDRGSTTLAIRDLETKSQRELTPALNTFLLRSWSPDGRFILVNGRDRQDRVGNYQIDAETGRVTALPRADRSSDETDIRRAEWMPDGRLLSWNVTKRALVARTVETGTEDIVFDARKEGVQLVSHVLGCGYKLSPDGQTLAFTSVARDADVSTFSLAIKVLGGGPARELARASGSEQLVLQDWTPDGAGIIFTRWLSKPDEPVSLWRVSIHGGDPQPLGLSMPGVRDVGVHPDGTHLTFTAGWPKTELWVLENFLMGTLK